MDLHTNKKEPSLSDCVFAIKARRALIIPEIEQLKGRAYSRANEDEIHRLQQEYNGSIDEEMGITPQLAFDPFEVLPPELWKDVVPNSIDDLLVLMTVSTGWCNALTSTPHLWTNIVLDQTKGDYMSKAALCLAFSGTLEVNLRIELSLEVWKEVAPMFTVEGDRIHTLEILFPKGARLQESLDILASFTQLKFLKRVRLPFQDWSRITRPDPSIFEHMPSLIEATSLLFTVEMLNLPWFSNLVTVNVRHLNMATTHALMQLRELKSLFLTPDNTVVESNTTIPLSMQSCLLTVIEIHYYGHAFENSLAEHSRSLDNALRCMGQNLTRITARRVNIHSLPDLLASLQRFHRLSYLELRIEHGPESSNPTRADSYTSTLSSVRTLCLLFADTPSTRPKEKERQLKAFAHLFDCMVTAIPLVNNLTLEGAFAIDLALEYVWSLHTLRSLIFMPRQDVFVNPRGYPANFLDYVDHSSLQHLQLATMFRKSARCNISSNAIPTLITLSLTVDHPIRWGLDVFTGMRTVIFNAKVSVTWASDFLEELLMQPNQLPSLERIKMTEEFLEWDLLILMLERRNFVAHPHVKHITILELTGDIPYKLSYPLSHLLNGRFAEREPISAYSIAKIASRKWDPAFTGCTRCMHMFRSCDAEVSSTRNFKDELASTYRKNDWGLALRYELPHQRMQAEPSLSPDIIQWLTGKWERRCVYVNKSKEVESTLYRKSACSIQETGNRPNVVLGDLSLDGANFEDTHSDPGPESSDCSQDSHP